jgi:rRNA 2'-O-methyltransferase fibrillarin
MLSLTFFLNGYVNENSISGEAVYGEKRISVDNKDAEPGADAAALKIEYRVWNPFR